MSRSTHHYRVLIAEDDTVVRKSTATFLAGKGYEVLEAASGQEARALLSEKSPDIILTDLRMPGIDGGELLEKVFRDLPDTPVIVISGMGTMQEAIELLRRGAFDYISKPVEDMELIRHSMEKALQHAELQKRERSRQSELERLVQKRTWELQQQNSQLEEEIQRRKTQEALVLQAKQEWERTVDAMPDMIALIDRNYHIVRMNETMRKTIGTSYKEILAQPCFTWLHCSAEPHAGCPHRKTLQDGGKHTVEFYEPHLERYLEVTTVPYNDPDGTLLGSVHIVRDITERCRAEKDREKLQSQLLHAQKLESVGRLAAGIAHEINTPTQFIGTNVDFVGEAIDDLTALMEELKRIAADAPREIEARIRTALDEADWDYLAEELPLAVSQSREGVRRVSSIVRAMKEFSHPGSRDMERRNLNQIIETTVTVARNEWKYVAEVELDLDPELPPVSLLADEMGQVILNMLINAAHAIADKLGEHPESEKGVISISTEQDGDAVLMRIRDSGMGISEEIQARIFDPFFTTKEVGKGTGQGLAIAHDVVDKHHGEITVASVPGQGTAFTIRLPLQH